MGYACHYKFSPNVKLWLNKCHSYRALIRLNLKYEQIGSRDPRKIKKVFKKGNPANIFRTASNCGIQDPQTIDLKELYYRYKSCREHAKKMMAASPWMRKTFLSSKLREAIEADKKDQVTALKQVLRSEAESKEWQGIQRATKPDRAGAISYVEVQQQDGTIKKCDTKESCESAIGEEIKPRFDRANSAPVCQGALFDLLGYEVDTDTAMDILEGKFNCSLVEGTPTGEILKEIAEIWKMVGNGKVDIFITKEDFQHFWKRAKERTSSSRSGQHIGHYKAAALSDYLSEVHALKLSLISKTGSPPERWARGLSVMLEKIAGVALVTKLRAILLLEADYNYHSKLIFSKRMMELARSHGIVPEEIYSEKGRTAEDAVLHQVLAYDIARQTRAPLLVASVDASQCYDRMAHSIAGLTLQASGVPPSSVRSMLKPIREMEFFICAAFGESDPSEPL